ncbi:MULTISPECIES: flavin-containing monooxygenase [unclassified Ketobacter]|uniref:flavin-containing monooxygenase n=1 Tax=unclassified Ketobacter TaxID=2639109 RepID=UPI000F237A38|nr:MULTISPECIES: NAD(P)/FAD-dependent oxidoreductase [unclassified Ketobacter]MEC8810502.1 NAD(P)/FAD-dependent oxidoreductase [Pseudomonadota bacterium]RLT90208.1 MAG: NAD(P)/FAD-dependent oxidoreductase [Ketobacter sp. GenoA1]RLT93595.1 MAG: NAD(P)/FAD-dependent oxidoreductase [Ketobacter sp.]
MKCKATNVPSANQVDIPALKEKYRQERELRVRPEGQKQYVRPVDDFSESYEVDPHTPLQSRASIHEEIDALVLGGGWSGLLAGVNLKKAGVTDFRNIDHAGDFGGVWYWNRYPGVQCDNDAYCYLPMLEEMDYMPSKKYTDGYDIYDYMRSIADRFGLYEKALFHTMVTGMKWDQSIKRWRVTTNRGDEILARFVVMANGLLNIPKLPGIAGIHEFKGRMFHTARWDYEFTGGSYRNPQLDKLADKRVAIIGTGATAIQAVPYLGRYAKQLYVLQRTPSTVDERKNLPTDPAWVKSLKPGWQQARKANFQKAAIDTFTPGDPDLICDIWTEVNRNLVAEFDASGWPTSPETFMAQREVMDYRVMERLRQRVDSIVKDKKTAEGLKPWYRFLCKRPCSNDDYYSTFNLPNVQLIDVSKTQGVERMTEHGFVAHGQEYEIDCMIFASGFEVTSDLDRRWGIATIQGRDGVSIYDHWADGYKTLHGMMSRGFPNQFFVGFYQGGFNATTTETFSRQGEHIAYIIKTALDRGATSIEPDEAAQNAWVEHVRDTAIDISEFQQECTPSYFNNEGEAQVDSKGEKKFRWYLGESYGPGWDAFQKLMHDWRDKGELEGLVVTND